MIGEDMVLHRVSEEQERMIFLALLLMLVWIHTAESQSKLRDQLALQLRKLSLIGKTLYLMVYN